MAAIDWPVILRGAIKNTKQISQAAGFIENNPAAGAAYTQFFSDDEPTLMQFDLMFTRAEAQYFDAFSRVSEIFSLGVFFNFPIYDEYGITMQEVRFLSNGKPSYSENGLLSNLTGCQIIIPNYIKPDADYVIEYYDLFGLRDGIAELNALDTAININYPQV